MQPAHISDCDIPRQTCFSKASRVGGQFSIAQSICVNKYLWHLATVLCGQVSSYMRSMKCSIISKSLVEISPDGNSLIKVSVISGKTFHGSHAVGLPRPKNCDTVSHPVNVYQKAQLFPWHAGRLCHLFPP